MHSVPSHFVLSILPAVQQGGAPPKNSFCLKMAMANPVEFRFETISTHPIVQCANVPVP